MRLWGGMGNPTRELFHVELTVLIEIQTKNIICEFFSLGEKSEARRRLVPHLNFA